jgi:two-component system nitrogen regulation response regulator NtrX
MTEETDKVVRRVVVVDDEKNIRRMLRMVLEGEGYTVETLETAESLLPRLERGRVDVVLLDVRLPGMDGIECLGKVRAEFPDVNVIMISGHASLHDAVRATKLGAFDFLEKPLDRERVLVSVRNSVERRDLHARIRAMEAADGTDEPMLGESAPMQRLKESIAKIAPSGVRVLITGESGTGKELIARALHRASQRASGPFVKINCAAIPSELIESELFGHERGAFTGAVQRKRGCFELADGGTLFLDEIGDMSLDAQAKVLRAIQTGEITRVGGEHAFNVDVRLVAATNKDLDYEVRMGAFREDLYYRLSVVPMVCPPLRDRGDDVLLLLHAYLDRFAREHGLAEITLTADAETRLRNHSWPGNVRELRNLAERLVILAENPIRAADLPPSITSDGEPRAFWAGPGVDPTASGVIDLRPYGTNVTLRDLRDAVERDYILRKLDEVGGHVTKAAELLGIERTNLHKKLKTMGWKPPRKD